MQTMRLVLVVVLLACASSAWAQTAKWTFMVYMAADNDLEPFGIADFNEMETVGSSADVQIIVQFDRSPQYDQSNGDWTDTRRFRVTQDLNTSTISSAVVQNLGEVNMGSPEALVDFVNWAKQSYPAERYCLVLWDHGGGWKRARLASEGLRTVPAPALPSGTRLGDILRAGSATSADSRTGISRRGRSSSGLMSVT